MSMTALLSSPHLECSRDPDVARLAFTHATRGVVTGKDEQREREREREREKERKRKKDRERQRETERDRRERERDGRIRQSVSQ